MNWMLLTALALAFGIILGNLMLLRYLDKLPGNKPPTKADATKAPSSAPPQQAQEQEQAADSTEQGQPKQGSDDSPQ